MAESSTFEGQVRGGGEKEGVWRLDDLEEEGLRGSRERQTDGEAALAVPLDLESKDLRRSICKTVQDGVQGSVGGRFLGASKQLVNK